MPRYSKGLEEFNKIRRKKQAAKAHRLVKYTHSPPSLKRKMLWKDEQYMKKEEYEAYIDKYLALDDEDSVPNESQTKIAKGMYDTKCKYEPRQEAPAADIDMGAYKDNAKALIESEPTASEETVCQTTED